jgi:hypothetical protein
MSDTTATIDDRLARLEERVAELERRLAAAATPPQAAPDGLPECIRRARASQAALSAAAAEFFDRFTQGLKPIPAEELQQMTRSENPSPNGMTAAEEIIAMREE